MRLGNCYAAAMGTGTPEPLEQGGSKQVRILNMILRLTEHGAFYEADPRHVELLARSLNLSECKPRFTPGNKDRTFPEATEDDNHGNDVADN